MQESQKKMIRDSVQGYIYIDKEICEKIIDTDIFQRLRRIEQTSMRCLYPAASHDRFIHSIGVYNLAKVAIQSVEKSIQRNATKLRDNVPEPRIRQHINFCFKMAALLHDVGHAPFSHTLEDFFGIENVEDTMELDSSRRKRKKNLIRILCTEVQAYKKEIGMTGEEIEKEEIEFTRDLSRANAASHELMSAIVVLQSFKKPINELAKNFGIDENISFEFVARCITGAQYEDTVRQEIGYCNCVIRLLNSSIDVDKLDYISRDSSISGYDNMKIDVYRLLKALVVDVYKNADNKEILTLAFGKNAISVVENVIISRNSLYTWVYAHHKIKYETFLIQEAIKNILKDKSDEEKLEFYHTYFSPEALRTNLICDSDIWCLLKKYRADKMINEIFDRRTQRKAIWKSFNEFEILFASSESGSIGSFSLKEMRNILKDENERDEFKKYLDEFGSKKCKGYKGVVLSLHNVKLTNIRPNSILVQLNQKLYGFDGVMKELHHNSVCQTFFYLFYDKNDILKINKQDLVEHIKKYSRFNLQPDYI